MLSYRVAVSVTVARGAHWGSIGHFNVSDLVALKAVTEAAHELKMPVIVVTSEGERSFLGVREIAAVVASPAQKARSSDLF